MQTGIDVLFRCILHVMFLVIMYDRLYFHVLFLGLIFYYYFSSVMYLHKPVLLTSYPVFFSSVWRDSMMRTGTMSSPKWYCKFSSYCVLDIDSKLRIWLFYFTHARFPP